MSKIKVTIWNEFRHEKTNETVKGIYPDGMHMEILRNLEPNADFELRTAVLDDPEHGLTEEVLNTTDVLIWWGHMAHGDVQDEIVNKVYQRVMDGMGLIVLHSGHASKIFKKLCGTNADELKWRDKGEKERLWVVDHSHPIAQGINEYIELEKEEMYGEHFNIPNPDELIFISWFAGGEVFRSGFTLNRGLGKVFYFRPGHETFPTFKNKDIMKVIENAVRYVKADRTEKQITGMVDPIENITFE